MCDAGKPRNARLARAAWLPDTRRGRPARIPAARPRRAAPVRHRAARRDRDSGRLRPGRVQADARGRATRVAAQTVLLATGVSDQLPDVPGIEECYGITVHHCPYCDGWEVRDRRARRDRPGRLGRRPRAVAEDLEPRRQRLHERARADPPTPPPAARRSADSRSTSPLSSASSTTAATCNVFCSQTAGRCRVTPSFSRPASGRRCDIPRQLGCELTQEGRRQDRSSRPDPRPRPVCRGRRLARRAVRDRRGRRRREGGRRHQQGAAGEDRAQRGYRTGFLMPDRAANLLRHGPPGTPTAPVNLSVRSIALTLLAAAAVMWILSWAREVFIPIVVSHPDQLRPRAGRRLADACAAVRACLPLRS